MTFAYWRKCDLQIHTPRDPNWSGARPLGRGDISPYTGVAATDAEIDAARERWADAFVDACLERKLGAISITDHHDMVMLAYVQEAIVAKKRNNPSFDLWLFPGMELTAAGGKQVLILFDSDLSNEWRRQAQGKLGIVYAEVDDRLAQCSRPSQLSCSYADIARCLDEIEGLRGKYIVLPNCSQGGKHTVLMDGGHAEFRRMPYVGGYLDSGQSPENIASTNKKRLSGENNDWAVREIYPIPTSDCRKADFEKLGTNDAWIKLAEPTAEAIRQAFLSRKSRISVVPPEIASLSISSLKVDNSSILGSLHLTFSPEQNAVIGGRGSGKSSLLELIAYGLGRSCHDVPREHYSGTGRNSNMLAQTFTAKGGVVILEIVQDEATFHIVRAPSTSYQPQVIYPDGQRQLVSAKELRSLFPSVVYSQGELAEIGKQTEKQAGLSDLLQFVSSSYKREDDELSRTIEQAKNAVRTAVQTLVEFWLERSQATKLQAQRDALLQRAEALEKTLPKLAPEDRATVERFDKANEFETKRQQATHHADKVVSTLEGLIPSLLNKRDLTNEAGIEACEVEQAYEAFYAEISEQLPAVLSSIMKKQAPFRDAAIKWDASFQAARKARDDVLLKIGTHKTATQQVIALREDYSRAATELASLESKLQGRGDPARDLVAATAALKAACTLRTERVLTWSHDIEVLSNGKIKAVVHPVADITEIREAIDIVAAKTGSQEGTRMQGLDRAITATGVWELLDLLRTEGQALLFWCKIGCTIEEEEPAIPQMMRVFGDTPRIRSALAEKLDTLRLQALASAIPKPLISLFYCDEGREIAFDKASEGQRAAALLFMLLEQPGGPLLIDQPEGDLDNAIISDLTDKLHEAKKKRQLIFVSHNANIVVNGSSESVAHLAVASDGGRQVGCAGAIDCPPVRNVITKTMEGGAKAFKDRQEKYGY